MSDLLDALEEHFGPEEARVIDQVLRTTARYVEGDAFAGSRLRSMGPGEYAKLTELFEGAGIDREFEGRLGLMDFVKDPGTHDEELNEAIEDL